MQVCGTPFGRAFPAEIATGRSLRGRQRDLAESRVGDAPRRRGVSADTPPRRMASDNGPMNLRFWKSMAIVFAACATLHGQGAPSMVTEAKQAYGVVKNNLLKTAEKMPAESYDFKPMAEIRAFAAIAHIADARS